jgi:hypothetical protein
MNPSSNESHETIGMQLPPPIMEQAPTGDMPAETLQNAPEQVPAAAPEKAPTGQSATPPAAAIPLPVAPAAPVGGSQGAVSATTQSVTPTTADDGDLIEKEWVNKAKAIVERTRDDPYRQSEELTVVKADYMKQRYNKTIKLSK